MMVVLLALFFALSAFGATPVRELYTQAVAASRLSAPEFRHGYLVVLEPGNGPASGFTVYAPDGSLALTISIEVPGGSHTSVTDVDFDSNGNIAVTASALGTTGYLNGILMLDPRGRQTRFINTGRFVPCHVTIAQDHSVWTLGWQRDSDNPIMTDQRDYMVVRQYSIDGEEMKAVLPRSSFPAGLEPGTGGSPQIAVTADRVGVLVYSGQTSDNREWVELDLNGKLLHRSRIDDTIRSPTTAAFTADGHIYLQGQGYGPVYTLERGTQVWRSIETQGAALMGGDSNSLVYRQGCCGMIRLQWFNQP
jgi:hypothetical protein